MKYGALTNRVREFSGRAVTVRQLERLTGATHEQIYGVLFKLKSRGEVRQLQKGDRGRFSKRRSWWKINTESRA